MNSECLCSNWIAGQVESLEDLSIVILSAAKDMLWLFVADREQHILRCAQDDSHNNSAELELKNP